MGLVKAKTEKRRSAASKGEKTSKLTPAAWSLALEDSDSGIRRRAAKEIASSPNAAELLLARLQHETDISVREAIFNSLISLKDSAAMTGLLDCLRSEDAALRNEALEAMRQVSSGQASIILPLLKDPDPDVRVLAVNILDSNRDPYLEKWLIEVIDNDTHVNVCAAALNLLCEVGTEAATDALTRLIARFESEPYIQFAAKLALKRIRGA